MERLEHDPSTLPESPKDEPTDETGRKDKPARYTRIVSEILKDLESINDLSLGIACPLCFRSLQRYGKKVGLNSVLLQRFVCPECRSAGRKYNYFLDIKAMVDSTCTIQLDVVK